jgi:hypothetical protein
MRSKALLLLVVSLALLVVPTDMPLVGSDRASACADVSLPLRNFKVEAKWQSPKVKIGSMAKVDVLVTRTADEDPVTEEGEPWPTGRPMDEPVEDAMVGVGVLVKDVFLAAGGYTDAEGKVTVKIKVEKYTKPGDAISRIFAKKDITPADFPSSSCRVVVYEYGQLQPGPGLEITR